MKAEFKKSETFDEFKKSEARAGRIDTQWHPMMMDDGPCCGFRRDPPKPVVLQIPAGSYEITGSRYPLLRLAVEVLRHRAWHFIRGDGFRD